MELQLEFKLWFEFELWLLLVGLNGDVEGRAECARPLPLCSPFSHVETVGDKKSWQLFVFCLLERNEPKGRRRKAAKHR